MSAPHPLDEQLAGIAESVDHLGGLVCGAVREATRVLLEADLDGARRVIDGDDELDAITLDIEDRCLHLLVLQGPRAKDLRSVIAALRMASELERCGDLASNIAKAARRLYHSELDPTLRGMIDRMSQLAERQLESAIVAYRNGDEAWAAALDDLDDELDDLHRDFVEEIFTRLRTSEADLRVGVQLALIGRFYERLGDHAVNLGERIRYQLTGWTPELSGAARHAARRTAAIDPASRIDVLRDQTEEGSDVVGAAEKERRLVEALRRDFVANIGHELRTPLGAVSVLAETLRNEVAVLDTDATATVVRLSDRLVHETERLTCTVEDLLELSRIESGEPLVARESLVAEVVSEAVERCDGVAELAGVRVTVDGVTPEMTVSGDRRQLISALANLIGNALRYSDDGQVVSVKAQLGDSKCRFVVTDRGIGIPRADQERIFERFYRVDRARRRDTGGTGLGLAIVRHVALNHAGEVTVESTEGNGSTFTLSIPIDPAGDTDPGASGTGGNASYDNGIRRR